MKQNKSIDWRTIGNLIVVCICLVNTSLASAQAVIRDEWLLYGLIAVGWAAIATTNLWIAISRMLRNNQKDN